MYKEITIKRQSTDEQLISQRTIYYDVYENGEYSQTFEDINDAMEYKEEQERKDREYEEKLKELVKSYEDKELEEVKRKWDIARKQDLEKRDQKKAEGDEEAANIAEWRAYEAERIVMAAVREQNRRISEAIYNRKQKTKERLLKSIEETIEILEIIAKDMQLPPSEHTDTNEVTKKEWYDWIENIEEAYDKEWTTGAKQNAVYTLYGYKEEQR